MSPALLVPAGLAALAAVLVPLLIHLARRSEQRPVVFAALRWLQPKPKPRHRLRFDEWPLLLVRLLLLVMLALLLARPVLLDPVDDVARVAVVPGVELPARRTDVAPDAAKWLWLAPGFPAISDGGPPPTGEASVTSLLRELDAQLPPGAPLTVLVPDVLEGVDAQRPVLSRGVDWRVRAGAMPPRTAAKTAPPPRLTIRHDEGGTDAARYLRAVHAAWQPSAANAAPGSGVPSAPLPPRDQVLAWLVSGGVPAPVLEWVRAGGTLLIDDRSAVPSGAPATPLWRGEGGEVLVEGGPVGDGRVLRFTRPLAPATMPVLLEPTFPSTLRRLLEPPPAAPARVVAAVHVPSTGAAPFPTPPRDLTPWFVLAILLVFAIERALATATRGREAP